MEAPAFCTVQEKGTAYRFLLKGTDAEFLDVGFLEVGIRGISSCSILTLSCLAD